MLSSTGQVAKLYLSVIDDVIESMRELFVEEGFEDRVLDDLRHLWESKMMQSKAMEDFRKNNINSSDVLLQLSDNYKQTGPEPELTASVVIPSNHSFPVKYSAETLATFSLPPGLTYPVQIPAGVTLQTASGQFYKVNVPVVVTQAPAGQHPSRNPPAPKSAAIPPNTLHPQQVEPFPASSSCVKQAALPDLPTTKEINVLQEPPAPAPADTSHLQEAESPHSEVTQGESEPSDQSEPVNSSSTGSNVDIQLSSTEGTLTQTDQLKTRDIDDILKRAIEEEREKAQRLDGGYSYSELSDIVQLDGPLDNSDGEEEDEAPLDENDFLGIINAEALKALQDGGGSSDSISSGSDGEEADQLADAVEEDPLNSGDDVIEQDIPDLFDTDNVIVCQYDKIHRSKNRWKFHLKDGVMSYAGRDYVFSKAVGEAEW
ncbi:TFIIA-alpha and beta-like factor isoform X2 [Cynoglossus semilaevis]|nr:TFIIA-alpha and beta-like factor isoform X2 [Cynoglossus semilaevis]